MTEPDAVMVRIGEGISLGERGEWLAARDLFAQVWSEIGGESGDPFHRCALAHSMADVQYDVHDELLWDLRALAAADLLTDERAAQGGVARPVAGSIRRCTSTSPIAIASSASLTGRVNTLTAAVLRSTSSATTVTPR